MGRAEHHIGKGFFTIEKRDFLHRVSLLFMGKHMDHCTGAVDVDDEKDAKKYRAETCQDVSMQESTLSFMLERKWTTQEEYANALPSPKGGDKATKAGNIKVKSWDVMYLKKGDPADEGVHYSARE